MAAGKKRTELYVGAFMFAGLFLLGGLILQFGKFRENLRGHYTITVVFDDASGVIKGGEVRMSGAVIGKVASQPKLNEAVKVEVELTIDDKIKIPAGSEFQIESATLLGDKLLVIAPPKDRSKGFIAPGSRIEGAGLTGLEALQNNAEKIVEDVLGIVKQAQETFVKADEAVTDLRSASGEIRTAMDKVNTSLLAEPNLRNFDTTLANLATTTARWEVTSAKFDPTVEEARVAIESMRQAAADAHVTFNSVDNAVRELRPSFAKIPNAVDEFSSAMKETGGVMGGIKRGKGLLGALAADNDVAVDVKTFMHNLKDYGILRYKNTAEKNQDNRQAPKKPEPKFSTPRR